MSKTLLLESLVRNRRDLLRLRIQGKQVARTLGFAPLDQLEIACCVFRVAADALRQECRTVRFELDGDVLTVSASSATSTGGSFSRKVTGTMEFAAEDCAWMAAQLSELVDVDVPQAIADQNEECLRLIQALRQCQGELQRLERPGSSPSAA